MSTKNRRRVALETRIRSACSLLRGTAVSISSIAYDVGFSSQSHMTTAMKKFFGVTPKECRKRAKDSPPCKPLSKLVILPALPVAEDHWCLQWLSAVVAVA